MCLCELYGVIIVVHIRDLTIRIYIVSGVRATMLTLPCHVCCNLRVSC